MEKGRGNTRLHFYSFNTTFSGRKSQNTRLDSVEAASVFGSVTARGRRGAADMWGSLVSDTEEKARGSNGS
jgi:hypothetical protein